MGRFGAETHKWELRRSASCACGAATQNAEQILFDCNLLRPPNTVKNLINVTDDTKNWLQHLAKNLRWALRRKKKITTILISHSESYISKISFVLLRLFFQNNFFDFVLFSGPRFFGDV